MISNGHTSAEALEFAHGSLSDTLDAEPLAQIGNADGGMIVLVCLLGLAFLMWLWARENGKSGRL